MVTVSVSIVGPYLRLCVLSDCMMASGLHLVAL